jgi:hypothetical protein
VLQQGLAVSRQLVRADRQLARDAALTAFNRSLLLPELNAYTVRPGPGYGV